MHMDEGSDGDKERANGRDQPGRDGQIGVGGGDDAVSRIQLAARWAEAFAPESGDTLVSALKRFRKAYEYLDSVLHGVEPVELEPDQEDAHAAAPVAAQPSYAPPAASPPAPEPEQRPWG
jgi:hypothetical protein